MARKTVSSNRAGSENSDDGDRETNISEKIHAFQRRIQLLEESKKITQEMLDSVVSL
jgi:hypothetical protein